MFDSIRKRGMNRNKYKEKQEVNIKNSTKNYLDMKRQNRIFKIKVG